MKTSIKLIHENIFNSLSVDVNTNDLSYNERTRAFCGTIVIQAKHIMSAEKPYNLQWSGEHSANDYLDKYGFILCPVEPKF
jgi:hypothetical protein